MNNRLLAHLALLGANLFYGAGYTVAKMVMPSLIQPKGFILIRVTTVTILFWLSYFGGEPFKTNIDKKDWRTIIICALFGVATNQLLFFLGLNLTSPIHASLMMLSTPILVSLFAVYALKDRLTTNKILGLILGVSGAMILVLLGGKDKVASNALLGDLFVLMNASSYAIYLVMVKPLMLKYRPIIVIRWIFLFGFLFVFPFGIYRHSMEFFFCSILCCCNFCCRVLYFLCLSLEYLCPQNFEFIYSRCLYLSSTCFCCIDRCFILWRTLELDKNSVFYSYFYWGLFGKHEQTIIQME
jgi:drug/metabolite transporter (DMT)-like permease